MNLKRILCLFGNHDYEYTGVSVCSVFQYKCSKCNKLIAYHSKFDYVQNWDKQFDETIEYLNKLNERAFKPEVLS